MLLQGADGKVRGGQRVYISKGKQRKMEMVGDRGIGEAERKSLLRKKREKKERKIKSARFETGTQKEGTIPS